MNCPGITRKGTPCERAAGPSGLCDVHDPVLLAERQRNGGKAKAAKARAEREKLAAEIVVNTIAEIRDVLEKAVRMAFVNNDPATMIRGVAVANELLKTADLEAEQGSGDRVLGGLNCWETNRMVAGARRYCSVPS
jgi:hypothetical protein